MDDAPVLVESGDLFQGSVQAAWVVDGSLHVVKEGGVAITPWSRDEWEWDGMLQKWPSVIDESVRAAWVCEGSLHVLRNGILQMTRWGDIRPFSVRRGDSMLMDPAQACWVAEDHLCVLKPRGVAVAPLGCTWDGRLLARGPALEGDVKTAWYHEGELFVVRRDSE